MPITLQNDPLHGDTGASGPGADFFYLTQAMNDSLPVTSGTPKLPSVIRAIKCVSGSGNLSLQSRKGNVISVAFATGDVHDLGYIVAVSGLSSDTSFVGYV